MINHNSTLSFAEYLFRPCHYQTSVFHQESSYSVSANALHECCLQYLVKSYVWCSQPNIAALYGLIYITKYCVDCVRKKSLAIWYHIINLGVFTKPFPNTIYWNALKHNKFRKNVGSCETEFRSNSGRRILNYPDFRSLIRELYACTLVLTKINLMLRFASKG